MIKRTGILALLAACGPKAATPTTETVSNEEPATPPDGVIRLDPKAPTKACPPGTLQALEPWDWEDFGFMGPEELNDRQLDACLAGNFLGPGVIVYASAPHPSDSQSEEGYPARRVIVGLDGKPVLEGPGTGGDWMVGPPTLQALVDLDGDGVHEILESGSVDPLTYTLVVWKLDGRELLEIGVYVTDMEGQCSATWSVGEADASGRRALILQVEEIEQTEEDGGYYGGGDYYGEDMVRCPDPGTHLLTIQDGMLVDDWTDPEADDEEYDGGEE